MLGLVTADEMRAAQILTGLAMALFISAGLVPGLQPFVRKIQAGVLAVYLLACAALITYVLIR